MSKENEMMNAMYQNLMALCNFVGQKGQQIDYLLKQIDLMKMSIGRIESRQINNQEGGVLNFKFILNGAKTESFNISSTI